MGIKRWLLVAGIIILAGVGYGVYSLTNLPGVALPDQGRGHKERAELDKFVYNSVPPTSGPHDPNWIRPGVYATPQDKYKLIHSLEHGYVIINYRCDAVSNKQYSIFSVKAHEDEGDLDNDSATASGEIRQECSTARILADFVQKIGLKRLIVQPNPEIDKPIALVAWARMLEIDNWDEAEATRFVKAFHNKGPEQTME